MFSFNIKQRHMKFKKKEYGTAKKGKFCGTNNIGYVKKDDMQKWKDTLIWGDTWHLPYNKPIHFYSNIGVLEN